MKFRGECPHFPTILPQPRDARAAAVPHLGNGRDGGGDAYACPAQLVSPGAYGTQGSKRPGVSA